MVIESMISPDQTMSSRVANGNASQRRNSVLSGVPTAGTRS